MRAPKRERPRWGFIVLILTITAICLGLGTWQMARLQEKETLIARIADRAQLPATPLPKATEWVGFDPEVWDFRHTSVTGSFRHDQTILVFTTLSQPRGRQQGPGYWVMAPLVIEDGGTVWVNRGFVPVGLKQNFADGGPDGDGTVTIAGILRRPERSGMFTPGIERADRIDYVRDPERFGRISDKTLIPVLPAYLNQDAGAEGALPQGGETVFDLPNRHFEYALTWYGLALASLGMLGVWVFARRKG